MLKCEQWHTGENGTSAPPWLLKRLLNARGELSASPEPAYVLYDRTDHPALFSRDDICAQCQAVIADHDKHPPLDYMAYDNQTGQWRIGKEWQGRS